MPEAKVERYRTPSRYDLEPHGSLWWVKIDDSYDIWVQTSKEQQSPLWLRIGPFLEKALTCMLDNQEFIDECLYLYENQEKSHPLSSLLAHTPGGENNVTN